LVPFEYGGKWGFKDPAGKAVVEPKYDGAGGFACGLAPVNVGAKRQWQDFKQGGKWGYIDARGNVVVPIRFECAHAFSEGLGQVSDQRGTRFLDPRGNVVIDLGKSDAGVFHEGRAPIWVDPPGQGKSRQTKFIDQTGRTVFTVDGYADTFQEGLAVLEVRKDGGGEKVYGYIDHGGKIVIALQFAQASDFQDGLAAVQALDGGDPAAKGSWGYIDASGKYAIPPQFNEARALRNGVALVHAGGARRIFPDAPAEWEGGRWRLLDRTGKVLKESEHWLDYDDAPVAGTKQ
jgi:hypothetical protein